MTPASRFVSRRQVLVAGCGVLCLTALVGLRVGGPLLAAPASGAEETPPRVSDPAAIEFLKQSMDRYAALKTFRADVDFVMSFDDTNMPQVKPLRGRADYQRTVAYAAPNRFRVTATAYETLKHIYVSDGERMVIVKEGYDQEPEHFDAPASFAAAVENNMGHTHHGGSLLYRFFAGRDGYPRLINAEGAARRGKQPPTVHFGPDVTVDGEPCKTVIFGSDGYDDERRAVISARDSLVRRLGEL